MLKLGKQIPWSKIRRSFTQNSLMALLLFLSIGTLAVFAMRPMGFQWDFFVFYDAGRAFKLGLDPYQLGDLPSRYSNLDFTFLPLTASLFAPLTYLSPAAAAIFWLALKLLALAIFLRLWHHFDRLEHPAALLILLLFGFNSTLVWDIGSGNLALFQVTAIYASFLALEKQKPLLFALGITAAALTKVHPILLGLAPLFLPKREWRASAAVALFFSAYWLANMWWDPEGYRKFFSAASNRVLHESGITAPSLLQFIQECKQRFADLLPSFLSEERFGIYLLLAASISAVALYKLVRNLHADDFARIALMLTSYVLILPRLKSYEFILLLPVAYYVYKRDQKYRHAWLLFFCLPVIKTVQDGDRDFFSSPHLGPVKRVFFVAYNYLPLLQTFAIWLYLVRPTEKR